MIVGECEYGEGEGGWPVYHFMISGFPLKEGLCLAAWEVERERELTHTVNLVHNAPPLATLCSDQPSGRDEHF